MNDCTDYDLDNSEETDMGIKRGSSNVAASASKSEDKKARYEAGLDLMQGQERIAHALCTYYINSLQVWVSWMLMILCWSRLSRR